MKRIPRRDPTKKIHMKTLLLLLAFIALPATAQDWKLDAGKSQIGFAIRQMNVPTEGGFKRFIAKANFDPARPESGRFQVEVDLNSIDTGSEEGDARSSAPPGSTPRATPGQHSFRRACARRRTAATLPSAT